VLWLTSPHVRQHKLMNPAVAFLQWVQFGFVGIICVIFFPLFPPN
jgi:hypothetical protein